MPMDARTEMPAQTFVIFIAESAREPFFRPEKRAPMAYAFSILEMQSEKTRWGWGSERSPQAMRAHGLIRAVETILMACDEPELEVVTQGPGTEKYLTEFLPKWLAEGRGEYSQDSYQTWMRLLALASMGSLKMRLPSVPAELAECRRIQQIARDRAGTAYDAFMKDDKPFYSSGVFVTDEDS